MAKTAFLNAHWTPAEDSGEVKGQTCDIACLSWCTAKSQITPVLFKYMGEDQLVYTVQDINVKARHDRNYNGLPSKEYDCAAVVGGFMKDFKLIYFIEESRWVMRL